MVEKIFVGVDLWEMLRRNKKKVVSVCVFFSLRGHGMSSIHRWEHCQKPFFFCRFQVFRHLKHSMCGVGAIGCYAAFLLPRNWSTGQQGYLQWEFVKANNWTHCKFKLEAKFRWVYFIELQDSTIHHKLGMVLGWMCPAWWHQLGSSWRSWMTW